MIRVIPVLVLALVIGCAGVETKHTLLIEAQEDVRLRDIGSAWQMPVDGGSRVFVDTSLPIEGIPSPITLDLVRTGLAQGYSITIRSVSGAVIVETAVTGSQGGDVVEALRVLFQPGNPFWTEEKTVIEGEVEIPFIELLPEELEHE